MRGHYWSNDNSTVVEMNANTPSDRSAIGVVIALSVTQIIGYGTLFYAYSILSPFIEAEFGWTAQTSFGVFSAGLLVGGLVSPWAGKLADRVGAGAIMAWGSLACAAALALAALSPQAAGFAAAFIAAQAAASFVQYSVAFVAIVQANERSAARSIVHLTLVAGFASTLFWPLTSWLATFLDWRSVLLIYGAANLLVCLPLHAWIASSGRRAALETTLPPVAAGDAAVPVTVLPARRRLLFGLVMTGFAGQAFALTAILVHMVPLTSALGMGVAGLWAATLFGPAQVTSRLLNMLLGQRLRQVWLAVISVLLLPAGIAVLVMTAPWLPGALIFMLMFGFGSGLNSIVSGTLPLELFGRAGYGATVGWISAARLFVGALAPFAFAGMQATLGVETALLVLATIAAASTSFFVAIAFVTRRG